MRKLASIKGKLSQLTFFCFVAYGISYFVPALIPNSDIKQDQRIHINARRINGAKYVEGDVLVKFKPKVSRHAVDAIADSNLSKVVKQFRALTKIDRSEYAHLRSQVRTTQQMIQSLKKNPQVEAVSPNYFLHVDSTIPNDPNFDYLWGLHDTGQMGGPSDIDIDAPEAWDITTGSSSIIVGVLDTGIDYNHPDLIPNMWVNPGEVVDGVDNDGNGYIDDIHGINAITDSGNPLDDHNHGTHCAGIIGAVGNNNVGVAGVNWNVKLVGAKFLDAAGYGTDADAIECINYLIDLKTTHGQNIVAANASFGGGEYDPVMESAIDSMGSAGIIFCAAAGNDWLDNDVTPHYPSSYTCSNIIAVTAVDYMGWQNFNYGKTSVDLGAPGVEILSTISAVYYPKAGDIFFDDMESGAGNWLTGGVNNSWAITTDQEIFEEPLYPVPSPPNFWSDSPETSYLPDTDSWLMNASDIDLSPYVGQNLYLGFGSAMLLELGAPVDHGYVEVSSNGGSTWQSLMDFAQYGYYWYIPWYFLIPDSVKTANFRFRFHLVTDSSIEYDGWLIDDVGIGTADYYGYGFKSGTSMATPHVTGAVALIAAQYPAESVTARINRILNNVTPLPSLVDTCVTEGMLNLYSALTAAATEHSLTISASAGGTTDPVPGTYPYPVDIPVNVSAAADTGYLFSHWTGDVPSGHEYDNPVTITMNTDKSITANFVPEIIQYTLDITANQGGTTNPSPGIHSYDNGELVQIDAIPDSGYTFSQWTGDVPSGHEFDDPVTITMNANKVVAANFSSIWQIISDQNSEHMYILDTNGDGNEELAVDFGSTGLWHWNGTWNMLTGDNPEHMVVADTDGNNLDELVLDFGSMGLWHWNGTWNILTGDNPEDILSADVEGDSADELVVDFGTIGLWKWNGAWIRLTGDNPENMIPADTDGDGNDELVVDFGSLGLWLWNGGWSQLTGDNPEDMIAADVDADSVDELVVDFGTIGLWKWDGAWTRLTGDNPEDMIPADADGDGNDELVVDFGSLGLWLWNGGWNQLTGGNPEDMIAADRDADGDDELVVDFGSQGLWLWDVIWTILTSDNPEDVVAADKDGDGDKEIFVDFGGLGLWWM